MKKIIIILAVILTSALTAWSLNRKDSETAKANTEQVSPASDHAVTASPANLATAD